MCSGRGTCALPHVGSPIRKSPGRRLFSTSPGLIAAVHVLHRLLAPRHPPLALNILTKRTPLSLCSFQGSRRRTGSSRRRHEDAGDACASGPALCEDAEGARSTDEVRGLGVSGVEEAPIASFKTGQREAVHPLLKRRGENGIASGRRRVLEDGAPSRWESPKATSSRHVEAVLTAVSPPTP